MKKHAITRRTPFRWKFLLSFVSIHLRHPSAIAGL
jgi:hypothetical protein